MTIYGHDITSDVCSGAQKVAVPFQNCYNDNWVYYSIDRCNKTPEEQASSSALVNSESSTTSATTSATVSSNQSGRGSSTLTTHASPSQASSLAATGPPDSEEHTNVGAIAGGTIRGVAFGITVAAIIITSYRRSKRRRNQPPRYSGELHTEIEIARRELPSESLRYEMPLHQAAEMQGEAVLELPDNEEGVEIGGEKSPSPTDMMKH